MGPAPSPVGADDDGGGGAELGAVEFGADGVGATELGFGGSPAPFWHSFDHPHHHRSGPGRRGHCSNRLNFIFLKFQNFCPAQTVVVGGCLVNDCVVVRGGSVFWKLLWLKETRYFNTAFSQLYVLSGAREQLLLSDHWCLWALDVVTDWERKISI